MILKRFLKNPFFLAAASAILLRFAYPQFNLWFFAFIAFIPLFFIGERQTPVKSFLFSFLSGTLFYCMNLFWLIHVTIAGMFVLSVTLGLYTAVFVLGFALLEKKLNFWQRLFMAPCWWVVLEYFRSYFLTGFPWSLLAYTQTQNLVAIQAADIGGAYLVSFLIIFVNIFIYEWLRSPRKNSLARARIVFPLLVIFLWIGYGAGRLIQPPQRSCPLKVSLVQGNISQDIKWLPAFGANIFNKYKLLTEIVVLKDAPDLVIWPETSYPEYLELNDNDRPLKDFAKSIRTPLLAGSIRLSPELHYFNSALLFSGRGDLRGVYDKIHLVPFGEYIPLRKYILFLAKLVPIEDFSAGREYNIFSLLSREGAMLRWGVLICFEDIFADLSRTFVNRGADFLVNMTNDACFGDTASPYQHMQASVFRAVENRCFVVRVANTGFSCIIDDAGNILEKVKDARGKETFVTGQATGVVYKTARKSLYTSIGDVFVIICGLYLIILMVRRRSNEAQTYKM